MIRAAILAAILTASSTAQASVSDRVLASTVMVGVQEPVNASPALYELAGQRPTWFRRLIHWLSYGSADVNRNPYGGSYYEAGAGAVIGRDRVLTAAHVVLNSKAHRDGAALSIRFRDGRRVAAKVEAIAPHFDAAVLRFELDSDAPPPLRLAHNSRQLPGSPVLIAGNPWGRAWWIGQGRAVRLGLLGYDASHTEGLRRYGWAIEGEATHGNSGGPVTNQHGELMAVVSSALGTPSEFAAVPADSALRNMEFWQAHDSDRTHLHCLRSRTTQ